MKPAEATASPPAERDTDLPRIRGLRLAAYVWEIAGAWFIILWLAGVAAVGAFAWNYQEEIDGLRRERLLLFLSEIRDKAETDLQLGFDIGEDRGVRNMLDDLIRKDPSVRSIEIFDTEGVSRHSTDRGTTGETVSPEWRHAAQHFSGHYWTSQSETDATLGVPLRGSFREPVGHLAITYQPDAGGERIEAFKENAATVLIVFLLAVLIAPFIAVAAYAREVAAAEDAFYTDDESRSPTVAMLSRIRRRLDDAMHKVGRRAR